MGGAGGVSWLRKLAVIENNAIMCFRQGKNWQITKQTGGGVHTQSCALKGQSHQNGEREIRPPTGICIVQHMQ